MTDWIITGPNDIPQNIPKWIKEQLRQALDEIESEHTDWFKGKKLHLRNLYSAEIWRNDWVTWKNELFEHELTEEIRSKAQNKMQELHEKCIALFSGL